MTNDPTNAVRQARFRERAAVRAAAEKADLRTALHNVQAELDKIKAERAAAEETHLADLRAALHNAQEERDKMRLERDKAQTERDIARKRLDKHSKETRSDIKPFSSAQYRSMLSVFHPDGKAADIELFRTLKDRENELRRDEEPPPRRGRPLPTELKRKTRSRKPAATGASGANPEAGRRPGAAVGINPTRG